MVDNLKECTRIKASLKRLCSDLDNQKTYTTVRCQSDLRSIPTKAGVYWIETTMPVNNLSLAAANILGKVKSYQTTNQPLVSQSGIVTLT